MRRSGNTLAEVLISMLALAVGTVAVATLFPTSVMRSINATRLTKSTLLRQNAEAMVDLHPNELVHDPDGTGPENHLRSNYIVDPWGWHLVGSPQFGNNGPAGFIPMRRYRGNLPAAIPPETPEDVARRYVTLPDSWVPVVDGEVGVDSITATSAVLSGVPAADLQQVYTGGSPPSRITLFDATAKFSITRRIDSISGMQVNWSSTLPADWLPGGRSPASSARIETQEWQFTWLLTVRNRRERMESLPNNTVDLVCFFRRDFSLQSERAFQVTGEGPQYTLDLGNRSDVQLKVGGWLMDARNARWHRIQRITNDDSDTPIVVLESPTTLTTEESDGVFRGVAIIMPGVVEVFPLGNK